MYCMKCGKKIPDIALFCPFCGTASEGNEAAGGEEAEKENSSRSESAYEPFDLPYEEEKAAPAEVPAPKKAETYSEALPPREDRPREDAYAGNRPSRQEKETDEDLFLSEDAGNESAYDEDESDGSSLFDEDAEEAFDSDYDDGPSSLGRTDRFEDEEPAGFFLRHIRGIVGGGLTVMLVLILLLWACTAGGQRVLARMNLAWQPGSYAYIGETEYNSGAFLNAARSYEKAYAKCADTDKEYRYLYALNTGICYDRFGDMNSARAWYANAINADSRQLDGYLRLLGTFPDPTLMSQEARNYIWQGYNLTHDERLNIG